MIGISSSDFLKEFTIYANRANDEGEVVFVQRANEKNVIMMSLDTYNDLQRQIYELRKKASSDT